MAKYDIQKQRTITRINSLSDAVFRDEVRKFQLCYEQAKEVMPIAIQLYSKAFNVPEHRLVTIVRQFANDLMIAQRFDEKMKSFCAYLDDAIEIEAEKMYEYGVTEGLRETMKDYKQIVDLTSRDAAKALVSLNFNSNNKSTHNTQNNVFGPNARITDMPDEVRDAMKVIAGYKVPQLVEQKKLPDQNVVDMMFAPGKVDNSTDMMFEKKEVEDG